MLRIILIPLFGSGKLKRSQVLRILPGSNERSRLVVAIETTMCGYQHMVLRQETHQEDVGWFVQSQIAIEPNQAQGMKALLTSKSTAELLPPAVADRDVVCGEPQILAFPAAG